MEILNKILAIDLNYIIIGLIAFFFTLEQVVATPFKFQKRAQHLFQNTLFMVVFILINILWATVIVFSIKSLTGQIKLNYYAKTLSQHP